jgi:regulator of protease activity HflC (stomatin/prohibitin superfamily)
VLDPFDVNEGFEGLFFLNGRLVERLEPGRYAFWKNAGSVRLYNKDTREVVLDISGQEIMTADKVTLRVNAVVTYRIADVLKAAMSSGDSAQALYREAQFALRAQIGGRELDALLSDRNDLAGELEASLRGRAEALGLEIRGFGIRDVILPGEMKALLNRVIEARKAAEAELIARREEVAAMRSRANTARMFEDNPTLMRLEGLEVLEKISENVELKVVLGGEKLSERITNLV